MNLLTQDEAAALLRCSVSTLARLRRSGALPYIPGRPVKIRREDLDRWVTKHALHRAGAASGKSAGRNGTPKADAAPALSQLGRRIALLRKR